jgi:hypothetical protein
LIHRAEEVAVDVICGGVGYPRGEAFTGADAGIGEGL